MERLNVYNLESYLIESRQKMSEVKRELIPEDLDYFTTYIRKKFIDPNTHPDFFTNPLEIDKVEKRFNRLIDSGDMEKINSWFREALTDDGVRKFWAAERNVRYKRSKERVPTELSQHLARRLLKVTGKKNVNEAVMSLLSEEDRREVIQSAKEAQRPKKAK